MKSFLLTLLFCLPSFAALEDGFDDDKLQIKPTILSEAQAQKLWNEFASLNYIPYEYATDGCYAQATGLALYAEKKGYDMAKVFAEGRLIAKLINNPHKEVALWDWHVAPVLYVQIKKELVLYAFDPSLFTKPVPVTEWLDKMRDDDGYGTRGKIMTTYYGSKYQYMSKSYDKSAAKKTSWMPEDLENCRVTLKKYVSKLAEIKKQSVPAGMFEKIDKAIREK
ncbi:MAG: hypothetical protein HUU57_11915 [Bdellovibrio sp.]|nr:hypothetical protein [Bdellovibrio sp.]